MSSTYRVALRRTLLTARCKPWHLHLPVQHVQQGWSFHEAVPCCFCCWQACPGRQCPCAKWQMDSMCTVSFGSLMLHHQRRHHPRKKPSRHSARCILQAVKEGMGRCSELSGAPPQGAASALESSLQSGVPAHTQGAQQTRTAGEEQATSAAPCHSPVLAQAAVLHCHHLYAAHAALPSLAQISLSRPVRCELGAAWRGPLA